MNGFLNWWQHLPSNMDPVIFNIGSFQLRYYGLMYIVAFGLTFFLLQRRIKVEKLSYSKEQLENFFFWVIFSVLVGGRLGYVLFYNLSYFINSPLEIFLPWDINNDWKFTGIAGMSYHGGTIGALISTFVFCRKNKLSFLKFVDFVIPAVPLGYTFGRLGNFINGELYGRVTDVAIGMHFPLAGGTSLRHPSQLYEGFFEGLVLFSILWLLRKKNLKNGALMAMYLIGYGFFRFCIEYVRQPDDQLGFVFLNFSMGQLLCFGMILLGLVFLFIPSGRTVEQ